MPTSECVSKCSIQALSVEKDIHLRILVMNHIDLLKLLFRKALHCPFQDTPSPNYSSRHTVLTRITASGRTIKTGNFWKELK